MTMKGKRKNSLTLAAQSELKLLSSYGINIQPSSDELRYESDQIDKNASAILPPGNA